MLILVRLGIRKDFWYLAEKRKEKRGEAGYLKNVSKYRAIQIFKTAAELLSCYILIFIDALTYISSNSNKNVKKYKNQSKLDL